MKIKSIISILGGILLLNACTDLSETLYDKVGSSDYGKTPTEIETIVGRAYSSLRGGAADGVNYYPTCEFVFFANAVASDECVIPTRNPGNNWNDGGVYVDIHEHTWKPGNEKLWSLWKYAYSGIASTNAIIYQVQQSGLDAESSKPIFAELKALRAYYYYNLLDWYGNVPIDTSYVVTQTPGTSPRSEVYKFVEKELLDNVDYLPEKAYGRFTKDAANLLLARLYLNSEVFIGQARWNDCLVTCSKIKSIPGTLELESDYFASFKTDNHLSKEIIFSIPYDGKKGTIGNYLASMTFHYEQKYAFSAAGDYQWCGNGIAAQPELYSSYDENDIRRKSLLIGPQIDLRTGSTIIMPNTGEPLIYTEDISNIRDAKENEGARLIKYEAKAGEAWERDHDLVLMRYAEVLMMQAECNVRLGNAGAARPFIEQVRRRAGLDTPDVIDLNFIDEELRREFVFEGHRRTDNIRFGTFFKEWWGKESEADKHTALYPIPSQEIAKNNRLEQNKGY